MKNLSAKLLLCLITALCGLTPLSIMAEDAMPPLAEEWLVTPKAHHLPDFHAALMEHVEVRRSHGDPWNWEIYSSFVGDDLSQYSIRFCCGNWPDFDAYEKWNSENPAVREHWMSTVDPHIEKLQHYYNIFDWDNSHWPNDGSTYGYVVVDEWNIKGGSEAQLAAARTKMSQIALNQGWSSAGNKWIWFDQLGGKAKVAIAIPHKNLSSLGGTGESFGDFLGKHMRSAEAGANLMQEFSSSTWERETTIWKHHPEFSAKDD